MPTDVRSWFMNIENTLIVVGILALIGIVLLLRFRSSVKLKFKGLGFGFSAEGKDASRGVRQTPLTSSETKAGNVTIAAKERAVAVGGNFKGNITTGNQIKK
jgi:hypothetical protein